MANTKVIISEVEFEVTDKLVISDPCYVDGDDGSSTEAVLKKIAGDSMILTVDNAAGTWVAEIEESDEGEWGTRVSKLTVTRKGVNFISSRLERVPDVTLAVDSGQMSAIAAESLPVDYKALIADYEEKGWNRNFFPWTEGAVSSSGYGDGSYPVFTQEGTDGRPARIVVDFLSDED